MTNDEMKTLVKEHLNITDDVRDMDISDLITAALEYCNLTELPEAAEPWLRKKLKGIIDYETENGVNVVFDIKSIHEGDTSITYNVDKDHSRDAIYDLSKKDKDTLRKYRRLRQ